MKPGVLGGRAPPFTPTASRPRASTPVLDRRVNVPILACIFVLMLLQLLSLFNPTDEQAMHKAGRVQLGNRVLRPVIAMISTLLAAQNFSRLGRFIWLMIRFVAYLLF